MNKAKFILDVFYYRDNRSLPFHTTNDEKYQKKIIKEAKKISKRYEELKFTTDFMTASNLAKKEFLNRVI